MKSIMSKKAKIDQSGGSKEEAELQAIFDEVLEVDKKLLDIEKEKAKECLEVEKKHDKKKRDFYVQRAKILSKIPGFWPTVLRNSSVFGEFFENKDDEALLSHLIDLDVETYTDERNGYKITLTFSENPYFTNDKIWRSLVSTETEDGEEEVTCTTSPINWKAGKNFLQKEKPKKDEKPGKKRSRDEDEEDLLSFFWWFTNTDIGEGDNFSNIMRERIFSSPVEYFLGITNDDFDFDSDEEDIDDEEDEEDDEDDE